MANLFELLVAPLKLFEDIGLSPFQAFVVIGLLTTGVYVKWTFQQRGYDEHEHDHHH